MRRQYWMHLAVFGLLCILPHIAHGASTGFFGPIIPDAGSGDFCSCIGSAPDWGCLLQVFQNVLNAIVSISLVLMSLFIAYAGFRFILSPANEEQRLKARQTLTNAVLGMLIILASWLIVDSVMKVLYRGNNGDTGFGPWNSILSAPPTCIKKNLTIPFLPEISDTKNPGGGGTNEFTTTAGTGGSCAIPGNSNNPCSVQSLSKTCFSDQAATASQVCMKESANGQQAILSGSDKLNSGSGPSYSVGLWQINLTTSKVGGLNCPAAFSGPCSGGNLIQSHAGWCTSTVKDQNLYNQCVKAAQDAGNNSQAACDLYQKQNKTIFQPWKCTASRCQIPGAQVLNVKGCAPGT
jgi:hypothetical protein